MERESKQLYQHNRPKPTRRTSPPPKEDSAEQVDELKSVTEPLRAHRRTEHKNSDQGSPRNNEQPDVAKPTLPLEINSEGNPALRTDRLLESESWSNAPGEHHAAKRKELMDQPRKTERKSTAKSNVSPETNVEGNPATQADRLLEAECWSHAPGEPQRTARNETKRDSPRKVEHQKAADTKLPWENDPGRGITLRAGRHSKAGGRSNTPGDHESAEYKETSQDSPRKNGRGDMGKLNLPLENTVGESLTLRAGRQTEAESKPNPKERGRRSRGRRRGQGHRLTSGNDSSPGVSKRGRGRGRGKGNGDNISGSPETGPTTSQTEGHRPTENNDGAKAPPETGTAKEGRERGPPGATASTRMDEEGNS